ncbi:MAG: hypothetical protein R2941_02565 [Desulfobacterales bacterium]
MNFAKSPCFRIPSLLCKPESASVHGLRIPVFDQQDDIGEYQLPNSPV